MVGYSKEVLFDYRHQYWLWTPFLGPIFGGLAGSCVYDLFIFTGEDSVVNTPNAAAKLHLAHAKHLENIGKGHALDITASGETGEGVHGKHPAHNIV
jgi:aquaglyceroporin related protein